MNDSIIQKVIGRSNLNRILLCILGIVVVFGLGALNIRYFYNFLWGPFNAVPADLIAARSASDPQKYWLQVTGKQMINTGVQSVSTSKSGTKTVNTTYFALLLDKRLVLVEIDGDQQSDTLPPNLTGWLEDISKDEQTEIIQEIETEEPGLKGLFLPFKLQTGDFRIGGIIGLIVGTIVLGFCLWGIVVVIRYSIDPEAHPILKALSRFGPLDFVTHQIETELSVPHTTLGQLHLTNNWLVFATKSSLSATRYADVAWLYKHITTQRYYGIPVSKTYTAMLYDRHGVQISMIAGRKEKAVEDMLRAIYERAPWAVAGYTKEIETAWKKDRAAFLTTVERRKADLPSS
jgi:hypothetical protein